MKSWQGVGQEPAVHGVHRYDDGTLVDYRYQVLNRVEIKDENRRENGRLIAEWMTSQMARERAAQLLAAADEADAKNAAL